MPQLAVVVKSDPVTLLTEAAEAFLVEAVSVLGDPSPGYLLALRQGGLREDLFREAAARGIPGWLDPPIAVFHELPAWLGASNRRPLGDFERAALLEYLLRQHGGDMFHRREGAFLAAVDRLFGELRVEGVSPEQYEAAVEAAGTVDDRLERFELIRDATLGRVYRAYVDTMARSGVRDGRDTLVDIALATTATAPERLGGRREIRIVGLADLRGGWRLLLEALAGSPWLDRIVIYLTSPLPLPSAWNCPASIHGDQPAHRHPVVAVPTEIIGAATEDAELNAVVTRVRGLLDGGAPPDRIAVVARDGRPLVDLAVRALERAAVPASARWRIGLLEIPVIRAVLAVLQAAARGWTRHDLVELGSQPYFASEIDPRVVSYLGFRQRIRGLSAWQVALARLLEEARAAEAIIGDDDRRPRTLPSAWVERARDRFASFAAAAVALDDPRPVGHWLAWLQGWLERDPWRIERRIGRVPDDRWAVLRLDLLGWRELRTIVAEWKAAVTEWPGDPTPLSPELFLDRLRVMLAGDAALYTETRRGVQVLESLAASHRSFDHVFLVGMNAGAFPRRAPSSMLLGDRDRERLRDAGLPLRTAAEWEDQEKALFHDLVRAARQSLTLSYVAQDELGGAMNPSSFVEWIQAERAIVSTAAPASAVCCSAGLAEHAHRVAGIERVRATGRPSPWNGEIRAPELGDWLEREFGEARIWAPTQLEAYAKCPWSFFSERLLRLRAAAEPDEDMDLRVRGSVLHDSLRRFYDRAREHLGKPVLVVSSDRSWAVPMLREAIRAALAEAGSSLWLGHPALRDVKHAELERILERYLDFEIEENEKSLDTRSTAGRTVRTAVDAHEVAFDGATLERDGTTIRYRGIIDRIEVGVDPRVSGQWVAAVDYKTSKWSAPAGGEAVGWRDGVVLQVPLYAHALATVRPGAEVARVEYRAIRHAKRLHHLALVRVKKTGVERDAAAEQLMEGALGAAVAHVGRIRGGRFPAAPAPSCNCPPFCHAWDICRVGGGPRTGRDG